MTVQQPISPALDAFGAAIKAARTERDWSLSKLALEALGNEDRKGYCSQVEKGRRKLSEGTILNFARALDLPTSVTDPLLGNLVPQAEETTAGDEAARVLLTEVETLRDQLKLSEALAVALAYKYADGNPTNLEGALKGLEAALEVAAKEQERGALPSNFEAAVDAVVARVAKLNEAGEVDLAYADLKEEAARRKAERERQVAQDGRVLDLLIAQAVLANDPDGYAAAQLEKITLEAPSAEDQFDRLRDLFEDRYETGLRTGAPFALDAAASLARTCIDIAPTPYLCAMAQNDLATVLANQGTRVAGPAGADLLSKAVETYRAALRVRTEADFPVDWAMTMQNLAIALQTKGSRTEGAAGAVLLGEAVETFRAALRVTKEVDHPVDWATTMQNLAIALETQGDRTEGAAGAELLREAVENYRAALRVRTEEDRPLKWAMTMQNLGGALASQGSRTEGPAGAALLGEAVDTFRAALRVVTETDHPVGWAMTMQNLAIALQTKGSRTEGAAGAALLGEAVDIYRATLRVTTEADHPVQWAITQENMAIAEKARAEHDANTDARPHLDAALVHVDNALQVFDPEHMSYDHGSATELRDSILAALDALP